MQDSNRDPSHLEQELKIPVQDLDPVRARLVEARAECLDRAGPETNTLFDRTDGHLSRRGTALRLRHFSARWILTFKGPTSYRGQVKEREELELGVDDGPTLEAVLHRLGLTPVIRYEKVRERWRLGSVVVSLDHTPLGEFVEIEGRADELEDAARTLVLDPAAAVRGSYLSLWAVHRDKHPERGLPRDMLFSR